MASCFHEQTGTIRRFQVGRVSYFGIQCPDCLRLVGPKLSPSELDEGEGQILPGDVPRADKKRSFQGPGNAKKRKYSAYLRTSKWKAKRDECLQAANWECWNCGEVADQADHITYERFGDELQSDLRASCGDCNQQARQDRISS